ncbi:hypothetical protein ACGFW5_02220 [Streptomyces sp. NPDC048416]|uniref:hypothetical protein n=1 Tax=Streptomyces sp. NPDC048416 TaxID=3365546 RepID=UPI00371EBF57
MEMQEWRDAWTRAGSATEALREALTGMGAGVTQTAHLRPMVSRKGTAWVDVGQLPAHLAERVAEVIRTGSPAPDGTARSVK